MKAYKVVSGVLAIGEGAAIALSPAQAASREGAVEASGDRKGAFRARATLNFKAGEIVGIEGDLVDAIGKGQFEKVVEASEEDCRAFFEREHAAAAEAEKAKKQAKEIAKTRDQQKTAVAAARAEGRKEGRGAGYKEGLARGDADGYARGFAEGKAAAEAEAAAAAASASATQTPPAA